jgi:zinc protease
LKRETVAEIIESRDSDRSLVQAFFRRAVFADHPYARNALGTVKGIESLTVPDVRAFYDHHVTQANCVVGFAGDVTAANAERLARRLIERLPRGTSIADPVTEPFQHEGRRLVIVDKPERTQTQIMIGSLGTWPHDEDHVALGVANAVLGGTFTSRLMKEIRSERGWSYGASARLAIERQRQAFSMWTFPAATDAAPCVALELQLFDKYIDEGVTTEEVEFIKGYLIRSQAFEVDTAPKRLHQALDVEILGLPADYHTGYSDKVARVTAEDANRAIKTRFHKENVLVTIVGTESEIGNAVRDAIPGLADAQVRSFEEE